MLLLTPYYNTNKGQVVAVDPNDSSDLPHDNYWHRYVGMPFRSILFYFYGMALLYSFPSNASLYISATYGFFAGVSAPNSTRRA